MLVTGFITQNGFRGTDYRDEFYCLANCPANCLKKIIHFCKKPRPIEKQSIGKLIYVRITNEMSYLTANSNYLLPDLARGKIQIKAIATKNHLIFSCKILTIKTIQLKY